MKRVAMRNFLRRKAANILGGLLLVALVLAAFVTLWYLPPGQVPADVTDPRERAGLENEFRRTLAQIIAGVVVLVGVYYTARRVAAAERTAEATMQNVRVAEEGQITERFTRAIQQLGDEKVAIRLGGIYALERIAKDSPRDHWQIVEVLTALLREERPWSPPENGDSASEAADAQAASVPTWLQAVLTVLGRRSTKSESQPLDLSSTDLRGANLSKANLEWAILAGANLFGANLYRADLRVANLRGADLGGADLREANLSRADLSRANLFRTDIRWANLVEANLSRADLRDSNITQEQLESARTYQGARLPENLSHLETPGVAEPDG